jgi:hypothetical protein
MVDYWPQEEGAIFDYSSYILPCYPESLILELSSVKPGATTTAGRIDVTASTTKADGIGIALKAASAGGVPERIPVLFYGAVKLLYDDTNSATPMGGFVYNSITTTICCVEAPVWADLVASGAGSSYILGMALQAGTTGDDSQLILVGKCL